MAPIKVGIIGLGATGPAIGPGAWAVAAHLASLAPSPNYDVVAVCNSSVESAQRSIAYHKLSPTTKAYGKPEDMAADPNVDLVVVSVIVTSHHKVAKPVLLARKQLFVEWPLAASLKEAEELAQLAREANVRTIVGTQFRADPAVRKVKELVDGGAIGRVTSAQIQYSPPMGKPDMWMDAAPYYLDFKSGGNEFHIAFGHLMDSFLHVLGDFETVKASLSKQYPIVKLFDVSTGQVTNPGVPRTAPDHIFVQGVLESGAVASINYHRPGALLGKSFRWLISGTEGEIEFTLDGYLQLGHSEREIRIKTVHEPGEVRVVEWKGETPEHVESVAFPGQNTARVWEAFAAGGDEGVASFEDGLRVHRLLERIAREAGSPWAEYVEEM
ncbi:Galactose/lactose metabolism regulatory protein GAL80 [Trichoderma ghanense]|uniref:Galactose/lactose metabolism regulatory protein GAL80 n=1 Tax=Trichoderma ghanense TaxID=65468 RepID=A0ABY2H021_9HYPO